MNKNNQLISLATALLVTFLAGGAFWLSFDALRLLAIESGISGQMAWLYPAIIDGAIIVFSLSVLLASLNRERTFYPWALVGLFTGLSVVLNIVHAPAGLLAKALAAIPPIALFLAFELLMSQIKVSVERLSVQRSLQELTEGLQQKQQELNTLITNKEADLNEILNAGSINLEKLNRQIEQLTNKKKTLTDDVRSLRRRAKAEPEAFALGNLNVANGVRLANKQAAVEALLNFLAQHPNATYAEMAQAINRSKTTASDYTNELKASGRLHKNGHGWEIIGGKEDR